MRAALLALAAVVAALAACGDTLVDHGAPAVQQGPGNIVCNDPTAPVACFRAGVNSCRAETVDTCGTGCTSCPATGPTPPPNAVHACLGEGSGKGYCGYACTNGLLKCTSGCCEAKQVASGGLHGCATTAGGALYCWGANGTGQVMGVPGDPVTLPTKRLESGAVAVAAGGGHTCVALASEVDCWGRDVEFQAPFRTYLAGVTALAAGLTHTCALVEATGAVHCWGTGDAVGDGTPIPSGAKAIAAGDDHTCALIASTGEVKCWGANGSGQLGNGSTIASAVPVTAVAAGIGAIAASGNHSCAAALVESGGNVSDAVRCWGDEPGPFFSLASPQTTPAIPLKDANQSVVRFQVGSLTAGAAHFCVQKPGDAIDCFGEISASPPLKNASGQLGGTPLPTALKEVVAVPNSFGATSFAAGRDHTCAVFPVSTVNGLVHGVWCWGSNASGQLGDGSLVTPGSPEDPTPRQLGAPVPVSGR